MGHIPRPAPPETVPVSHANGEVRVSADEPRDGDARPTPGPKPAPGPNWTPRRVAPTTRRMARAYWLTLSALTFLAPLMLLGLGGLEGLSAQRIWEGMRMAIPFTLIALPFSFLVNAPLLALTALPFAKVVAHTRAEHAGAFVAVATAVAMALPVVFVGLPAMAGSASPWQALGAIAYFAPFGALIGAIFWRVYAGAWVWRIEDPPRVADVFS